MNAVQSNESAFKIANLAFNHRSWEQFRSQGFILKDTKWIWTAQQTQQLKDAIIWVSQNASQVHVSDWAYYISHYKFDGLVPVKQVRRKIREMIQEMK